MINTNEINLNPYGTDVILDFSGDLVLGDDGDIMLTSDFEQKDGNFAFEGYVILTEWLYCLLQTVQSEFPLDILFGANVPKYLSQEIDDRFEELKLDIEEKILADDRFKEITKFELIKDGRNNAVIFDLAVKGVNENASSSFVFPFYLT